MSEGLEQIDNGLSETSEYPFTGACGRFWGCYNWCIKMGFHGNSKQTAATNSSRSKMAFSKTTLHTLGLTWVLSAFYWYYSHFKLMFNLTCLITLTLLMHVMRTYHKWTLAGPPTLTGAHQHAKTFIYINNNQNKVHICVFWLCLWHGWGFLHLFDNVAEHMQSKGALAVRR